MEDLLRPHLDPGHPISIYALFPVEVTLCNKQSFASGVSKWWITFSRIQMPTLSMLHQEKKQTKEA